MKIILNHDPRHLFFFSLFISIFVIIYFGEKYLEDETCKQEFPNEPCDYQQLITLQQVQNNQWVNLSQFGHYGYQDYRQLPQYGNGHAVFVKGSNIGLVHYNKYNAAEFPLGTIAHLAQFSFENTGLPPNFWVVFYIGISFLLLYLISLLLSKL